MVILLILEKQERDDRTRLMVSFDRLLFSISCLSFLCLEMFVRPFVKRSVVRAGSMGETVGFQNLRNAVF